MSETKPWYLSRTIWSAAVSVAATFTAMFGIPLDGTVQAALTEAILQTVSAIAAIFAIFGRLAAGRRIG